MYNREKLEEIEVWVNAIEDVAYRMNPEYEDEAEKMSDLYYFVHQIRNIMDVKMDWTWFF